MKILVIFTGGTIGSTVNENWISLNDNTKYTLIENYKKTDSNVEFDVLSPYSILSENLSANELTILCKLVSENAKKGYDGIIVTHGTDTIQYSASALDFTVNAKNIPIVLVSSNYPLNDERSNGNINFKTAIDFIKSKVSNGVFVAYKNNGDSDVKVHLASQIATHGEGHDGLYTLAGIPFASVIDGKVIVNKTAKPNGVDLSVNYALSPNILLLNAFPGDLYSYDLSTVNAVLIKPYHSGTLNTENVKLKEFCDKAKSKNIPVFVCNVTNGVAYDSSKAFNDLALTVLPFSSVPAIYVKIWLAISLNKNVKDFVTTELSNEFSI